MDEALDLVVVDAEGYRHRWPHETGWEDSATERGLLSVRTAEGEITVFAPGQWRRVEIRKAAS